MTYRAAHTPGECPAHKLHPRASAVATHPKATATHLATWTTWVTWGCLGLASASPSGALAAVDVVLRMETSLGHNSNALRLTTEALEEATPAPVTASDTLRLRADLGLNWDLGHPANRLQLTHQLQRKSYGQVPDLNGNGQYSTAKLVWGRERWITGQLSTSWRDMPERLDTGNNQTRSGRQSTQTHGWTVALNPTPTWSIPLQSTWGHTRTDAAIAAESGEIQEHSQRLGVAWSPQPGRTVGLGVTDTTLNTTPIFWSSGSADGTLHRRTHSLDMDWRISAKTQLNASLGVQRWTLPLTGQPQATTHPLSLGVDYRYSAKTRMQYQYRSDMVADFAARSGLTQQSVHDWSLNWVHSPKTRLRIDLTRARQSPAYQDGGVRGSESTRQWALASRLEYEWQRPWTAFVEWGLERKEIEPLSGPTRHIRLNFWQIGLRYDWERSKYDREAMSIQALP